MLILGTSCTKEFLELEPKQYLSSDVAISSLDDAQVAIYGVYDALQHRAYYGRNFVVSQDVSTDLARINPTRTSGRFIQQNDWTTIPTTDYVEDLWEISYIAINRANNVLLKIDDLGDEDDQVQRDQIKGEALFFRALVHFDLVRVFAQPYNLTDASIATGADGAGGHSGIPYVITPPEPTFEPPRDLVSTVYTNIIADLIQAESLMGASTSALYVSKDAATALLARVYLYMEDWANARDKATEIIDGSYSLVSNTDYIDSWKQVTTTESIFSLGTTNIDYWATDALGYIYVENGYGDIVPTLEMLDYFESSDVRGTTETVTGSGPANTGMFYVMDGITYVGKYPGRDGIDGVDNYPILRLSEMYLLRAEAYANLGNDTDAQTDLDAIRMRANPSAFPTTSTGQDLLDDIMFERALELCFEGHRLFDLIRTGRDVVQPSGTQSNPNQLFAMPIPQYEIDVNQNMIQNPAYE